MNRQLKIKSILHAIRPAGAAGVLFFCFALGISGQKVTRQSALNAFSIKNYESALTQFSELLANFPADPLYKYYCGVSLVELKKDPARASQLLEQAAYESGAVRSVPPDCFFYLGRAMQLTGKFQEAIKAYSRFATISGKKVSREKDVPELIKQCNEQKGAAGPGEPVTLLVPTGDEKDSAMTIMTAKDIHTADTIPVELDKLMEKALDERIKEDSLATAGEGKKKVRTISDSVAAKIKQPVETFSPGLPVYSEFKVEEKPVSATDNRIIVDPPVPPGLIYRIQVAVFRNPVPPAYFKGINPVQGFKNPATGVTVYYAGRFRRAADAGQALLKVKSAGFRDAFIVAMMDKKIVSNDRAAILEKEWGTKPLLVVVPAVSELVQDTVPPTLVFRVEVRRTAKPLPEDQAEAIRRVAAGKGFDVVSPDPKHYIYLIGTFLTYSNAAEYADLLVRNGYKEARVSAWLGKKEIPVETARQLFEQKQ